MLNPLNPTLHNLNIPQQSRNPMRNSMTAQPSSAPIGASVPEMTSSPESSAILAPGEMISEWIVR